MSTTHAAVARSVDLDGEAALEYWVLNPKSSPAQPLVLLHPWRGSWHGWLQVAHLVGSERTCLIPDLYSPGRDGVVKYAGPRELADAVEAMVEVEGAPSYDVVGNSMGGLIAQVLAGREKSRVRAVGVVGIGDRVAKPEIASRLGAWMMAPPSYEPTLEIVSELFRSPDLVDDTDIKALVNAVMHADKTFMKAAMDRAFAEDFRADIKRSAKSITYLYGDLDDLAPTTIIEQAAEACRDAEVILIPGASHCPHVENADEFVRALRSTRIANVS